MFVKVNVNLIVGMPRSEVGGVSRTSWESPHLFCPELRIRKETGFTKYLMSMS